MEVKNLKQGRKLHRKGQVFFILKRRYPEHTGQNGCQER